MFLVCGESIYDMFCDPLEATSERETLAITALEGDSPFNIAVGLSRLDCAVSLATQIQSDGLGKRLRRVLHAENVNLDHARPTDHSTPLAFVDIDETGAPAYAFYGLREMQLDLSRASSKATEIAGIHIGSVSIAYPDVGGILISLLSRSKGAIDQSRSERQACG